MFSRRIKFPDTSQIISLTLDTSYSTVAELSYFSPSYWRKEPVNRMDVLAEDVDNIARDGHLLDIRSQDGISGPDLLNPEFFSCAVLGAWTSEFRDQILLISTFASKVQFGVPYAKHDEYLEKRLPNWKRVQTLDSDGNNGSVIRVNPKYMPSQPDQPLLLPLYGTMNLIQSRANP